MGTPIKIFRQILILLFSSYFSKLLFAVATFIVIRHFDVAAYGVYATAFTFVSFFAVFLNFGINDLMVKQVSMDRGLGPMYLGNNMLISLAAALVIYLAMLGSGKIIWLDEKVYNLVFILGLAIIIQSLQQIFWSFLQVNMRIDLAGLGQVFFALFWVLSVLLVVVFNMSLGRMVILQLATAGLGLCMYILLCVPYLKVRVNPRIIPDMLRKVYPFGMSNILAFIYIQSDIFLVSKLQGDYEAGLYAAMFRLLLLFLVVPEMIYKTVLPRLFQVSRENGARARQYYNLGWQAMLLVMTPFFILYLVVPEEVVGLFFGEKYLAGAPALSILSFLLLIQALIHPTGQQLVALNKQHLRYKLQLAAAVVLPVLDVVVIPRFGLPGAAIVNLGCRLLLLMFFAGWLAKRGFTLSGATDYLFIFSVILVTTGLGFFLGKINLAIYVFIPVLFLVYILLVLSLRGKLSVFKLIKL